MCLEAKSGTFEVQAVLPIRSMISVSLDTPSMSLPRNGEPGKPRYLNAYKTRNGRASDKQYRRDLEAVTSLSQLKMISMKTIEFQFWEPYSQIENSGRLTFIGFQRQFQIYFQISQKTTATN